MHADEIDVLGKLRVRKPGVPGLGGTHRLRDRLARAIEILLQFLDRQLAAEQHLVADDDAHHVLVRVRQLYGGLQLLLVLVAVAVEPRAERDVKAVPLRELRYIRERRADAVGAYRLYLALEQRQVGIDLGIRGHHFVRRILAGAEW